MDELVSKAEVIKIMQDNWHTHNGDWAMQESMDDIRALPSVTPQPRKGHWILRNSFLVPYKCSECNYESERYDNYCPNCGAKMESEKT